MKTFTEKRSKWESWGYLGDNKNNKRQLTKLEKMPKTYSHKLNNVTEVGLLCVCGGGVWFVLVFSEEK